MNYFKRNYLTSFDVARARDEQILFVEDNVTIANESQSTADNSTISNSDLDDPHDIQNDDLDDSHNIKNDEIHTCCNACRRERDRVQDKIFRKLNLLINFIANPETNQIVVTNEANLLPEFPLATRKSFLDMEKDLQTEKIRKQFNSKIARIGGNSFSGKTRNILKFVLVDTLCQKLSWTGRNESLGIKDTVFANIIIEYVSNAEQCSLHEVQKVIQEWLRHAGDRVKYSQKTCK
ncbi:PREDICTED: uncharacterized protein LOC108758221 [Trachymyrmex cornetzi]|uniref:uncharacterized protein LOC108758221 n=1 Tax=Trachymyrmex cornetzi TaxID=471704 RepID=UPI00084F0CAA|nr:PREDICTED: uncharacterized protein LOC108758221 [Trachymyrmex cornetzi]